MQQKNLAAIDMGTNSCRLMIADENGKIILREAEAIKLGEGLYQSGEFSPEAMKRGIDCLSKFSQLIKDNNVQNYRAIATASCRIAKNGKNFLSNVKEKCQINFDIVDAREEAVLNLRGALLNADNSKYVLVYDIGGGSTEITLATNNKDNPQILYTISIPWGARNASEAFNLVEFDTQKAQKLSAEIKKYVQDFIAKSDYEKYKNDCCCLATSSTPLRLISLAENRKTYDRNWADGKSITAEKLSQVIDYIGTMKTVEMKKNPLIGENRAPIFIAGCTIFRTIYENLQIEKITASLKGAQEAIIKDLMNNG